MNQTGNVASLIRSRLSLFFVAVLIAGILIRLIVFGVDARELRELQSDCQWLPWAPIALGVYILGFALRGLRLKLLVQGESQLTVLTATNIVVIGHAGNNILPARLGEIVQAGMLEDRTGMGLAQALTTVFIERFLDGMVIIFLLLSVSIIVPLSGWMLQWSQYCAVIYLFGIGVILVIAAVPQWLLSVISMTAFRAAPRVHNYSFGVTGQILRALSIFREYLTLSRVLAASLCIWLAESLFFASVMKCFAVPVFLPIAVAVMSLTNLSIFFSLSPAYVGAYHMSSANALVALLSDKTHVLIGSSVARSFSSLIHLIFFATTTTWGLIALASYALRLGNKMLLKLETTPLLTIPKESVPCQVLSSDARAEDRFFKPSPFWTALAEGIVGLEYVERLGPQRAVVVSGAAEFLVDTLSALPVLLRLQVSVALAGFQSWVLLIKLRPFARLNLRERCMIVDSWAEGPVPLTRKLFRPLRSLVLLAFFEDAHVKAVLSSPQQMASLSAESISKGIIE